MHTNRTIIGFALLAAALPLPAIDVVDDFESGANPNRWAWTNNWGPNGRIIADGGNPGAWFYSTGDVPYFSDHPNFSTTPPPGSALRAALDSGALTSASIDLERLDASGVYMCVPGYDLPSTFTLELLDLHTAAPSFMEARTTYGATMPGGSAFPWTHVEFTIPSDATEVPPGWVMGEPPELNYTWQDLMHNVDAIRFFVVSPDDITYDACWELGADNVVVSYGQGDAIFADGFDGRD
ncbi:MAG TPA: hypothetical protein VGC30_14855 [Dokdonella sp.]